MLEPGLVVSRFLHYASILGLFGGALFPIYARAMPPTQAKLATWSRGWMIGSVILGLASGLAWFALTAASMAGDLRSALDPNVLMTVVRSTSFGPLWLARLALVAGVLLAVLIRRRRPATWTTVIFGGLALAGLAGTGHARLPDGVGGVIHATADAVHLLAAGVWLGGLWPLGVALTWASRTAGAEDDLEAGRMLSRFSGVGYVAVAVLVASGLTNTWYLVGSVAQLSDTDYGRLLVLKIALFVTMAALAAANRFWITPAMLSGRSSGDPRWLARIRRNVALEQALGVLVVCAVSVLGTMASPGEA
jgi:putative copper resistance protein D